MVCLVRGGVLRGPGCSSAPTEPEVSRRWERRGAAGRGGILADLAGAVSGGMGVLESCGRGKRGVGWVVRVQGLDGGVGMWGRD